MVPTDADVIIAGAGPAGSIAAYELARKGFRVLILEKTAFPRYKVCGGGLTHKIITRLPFSVDEAIETTIHTVNFSSHFTHQFSRTHPDPLMYCTMRTKLDQLLLDKAVEAGAKVLFNQQVTEIAEEMDAMAVYTKEKLFRSRLIIGADGASSIVARSCGLRHHIEQGIAWEAEIPADGDILEKYRNTVFLDWGTLPGGYGWVFPKSDHISVGVGGPATLSKQMMPYYDKFVEYLGFAGNRNRLPGHDPAATVHKGSGSWEEGIRSWPIPVRTKKGDFHKGNVLVVGDAAGLTDSLTGEGIYYAVASGKMAAQACRIYLETASPAALQAYTDRVNEELMTELLEGVRIRKIFNAAPLKIHHFIRNNDRAWNAFGKILRGERSYLDVRRGFGKWKGLWGLSSSMAGFVEKMKERSFRKRTTI